MVWMMETMLNTQQWLPVELLNIGLAAAVFFACLVLSLWKAVFDELNPVFWRRTAALLWAGVLVVALSSGIETFNWPQIVGWLMVGGGVAATIIRTGLSYYRQYTAHNAHLRHVPAHRTKYSGPKFSGR
ncbi:hypothetical protein KUG47_06695 [Falsochrobactrum sp. TDYN1]|uniref:Holin n=2 Tax=Falsochrobactrum tianjinense TaxID=2706015 RepID=A0A949PL04_9HYPH|nr:hypothetical protein [Falsochrobactrum sp. TDYN1]MBV2143181.1 hypothetical protein [Falsochrobactrum sp. TDYN1]